MMTSFRLAILVTLFVSSIDTIARGGDLDEDGIEDSLEQTLIDMYRPVLHFDGGQYVRPCSVEWYLRHSELIWRTTAQGLPLDIVIVPNSQLDDPNDPNSPLRILLEGGDGLPPSTTTLEPSNVGFRINVFDDFRAGPPEPLEPVGMYAHVTQLSGPMSYTHGPTLPAPPLHFSDLYLIQYWQFLPFNDFPLAGFGDHEGDWMWIDLLVERDCPYTLQSIVYHHHGDSECAPTVLLPGNLPTQLRPFPLPCNPSNLARVPQCFLEANVHEWWPFPSNGGECEFCTPCLIFPPCCVGVDCCPDNPSHDGSSGTLVSQNILNLGERFAPMAGLEPQIIMFFNGLWGHDHGIPNDPTGGPLRQEAPGYPYSPLFVAHVNAAAPAWTSVGLGSRYHPFTILDDAIDGPGGVENGGRVLIAPQSYPGSRTLSRPMRLEREGSPGAVIFGQ